MSNKFLTTIITLTMFTAAACNNTPHKAALSKTIPTSTAGVAQTKNEKVNALLAQAKNCLPLYALVKELSTNSKAIPFTIVMSNRTLTEDSEIITKDKNLNFGLLISPLKKISETKYGADLKSSELIGSLLSVTAQSDCDKVEFIKPDAGPEEIGETFDVVKTAMPPAATPTKATPGNLNNNSANLTLSGRSNFGATKLKLRNLKTRETREYEILGDNLVISVLSLGTGVKACDDKVPGYTEILTTYTLSVSGKDNGLSIHPRFARLLSETLLTVPAEISERADKVKATGVPVTVTNLETLNQTIQGKLFKEIKCN